MIEHNHHNSFTQGYVAAVVCLISSHGIGTEAIEVFRAGLGKTTLSKLKLEGVEEYDLAIIEKHWKELNKE